MQVKQQGRQGQAPSLWTQNKFSPQRSTLAASTPHVSVPPESPDQSDDSLMGERILTLLIRVSHSPYGGAFLPSSGRFIV